MCGTKNDSGAQACKFCGYIFENFTTNQLNTTDKYESSTINQVPPPSDALSTPKVNAGLPQAADLSSSTISTDPYSSMTSGTPLFVARKSIVSSLVPSIAYLAFILFATVSSGFSLYSLGIILFFILVFTLPTLFSPRKFEFYDDRLVLHKTIGADKVIPYSDLTYNFVQRGRRSQIVLSSISGKIRQVLIPGNPTNKEMGMDLRQFLDKKLKPPSTTKDATSANDSESYSQPSGPDSSGLPY
jgi:hypothetical protein